MVGGKPFLGPKGERGGEGWKAGACHRKAEMQVRASAVPVQVAGLRFLPKLAREGSAQPRLSQGFSGQQQTLAGMSGGVTDYTGATNTSGSLRPTASHKTSGLTQMGRET